MTLVNEYLQKTVLVILTSFHSRFSDICLKFLEMSVSIHSFKKVYILANCVTPEHAVKLTLYKQKFRNMECVFYKPKGLYVVTQMVETILKRHRNDTILKIDDDVFITKDCIANMIETYHQTATDDSIALVTPLLWNNGACLNAMRSYLASRYPNAETLDILHPAKGLTVRDADGCDFLWRCELSDNVMLDFSKKAASRIYFTDDYLSINCILFDSRLTDKTIPFDSIDEKSFNKAIIEHGMRFAIDMSALAYHYAFGPLKNFTLARYPLKHIEKHILSLQP